VKIGVVRRGERGIALLLALFTMVLMTIVVLEFTVSSQVDYRRAAMWVAGRRAALLADGGVTLAGEVLYHDFSLGLTDSLADIWAREMPREMPPIDTGAGMLAVRIEDEQAKLNLNALATGSLSPAGRRFQSLLDRLGLDPALASPLADWVDRNSDPGPGALAAEAEWYSQGESPYQPRNGPMRSYAELALVRGFTPEVLTKLRRFVTVLPEVESKLNVNTAPPEVLASMDPRLDDEALVKRLIDARTAQPFSKPAGLAAVDGMDAFSNEEIDRLFTYSSRWFRVRSTGDVAGAMRSNEALLERDNGVSKIVYLLPRRGPNIVGLDSGIRARLDDAGLFGAGRSMSSR
jgi:general secretion pathway protein K